MDLEQNRKLKFQKQDFFRDIEESPTGTTLSSKPADSEDGRRNASSSGSAEGTANTLGDEKGPSGVVRSPQSDQEVQDSRGEAALDQTAQVPGKAEAEAEVETTTDPEATPEATKDKSTTTRKENPLSDEVREWIDVWIEAESENEGETTKAVDFDTMFDEARKKFGQYRHHYFDDSHGWKTYDEDSERQMPDEEWFISNPPPEDVHQEGHPEYLCSMCRQLDFTILFTQRGLPGNNRPGPTVINLCSLKRLLDDERHCSFCSLLRRALADRCVPEELEAAKEVGSEKVRLTVLDDGPGAALRLEVQFGDLKTRIVLQVLAAEEDGALPLNGLHVRQDVAEMERLRAWIEMCDNHHPHERLDPPKSPSDELPELRVIDVAEKRVVTVARPSRYACLSYVWGQEIGTQLTSSTRSMLESPGGLMDESIRLGQTLRDAIKVTDEIGLRYLWIDALCILQDDDEDKSAIIAQMGAIYGNAAITIVASTNSDPRAGLPGVSTSHRSQAQLVAKVQGQSLAVVFHDSRLPYNEIERSVWNSRAWTFQERHLSRRAVYFTESQMFMTCPHQEFCEDTVPRPIPLADQKKTSLADETEFEGLMMHIMMDIWSDPTQTLYPNKSFRTKIWDSQETTLSSGAPDAAIIYRVEPVPGGSSDVGELRVKGETLWKAYSDAVKMYTQRKMKFQSDAINAFTGVAALIAQGINTTFWHGLPEFALDQALLWYPREPLKRRTFPGASPSWSWAGWEGQVSYRGRGWHNAIAISPLSVVRWLQLGDPQAFIDRIKARGDMSKAEIDKLTALVNSQPLVVEPINPQTMYHLDHRTGWIHQRDIVRNEHYYTHPSYPSLRFDYPCSLPSEPLPPRCSANGRLYFQAHAVPARFTDMSGSTPNPAPRFDPFLQIGLNDEARSIGRRPWEHIIYHQGYRAGYLSLNMPLSSLLQGDDDDDEYSNYRLVAMSRDMVPHIAPPVGGWDMYWSMDLRSLQADLLYDLEWGPEEKRLTVYGPHVDAEPYQQAVHENGDPKWENQRFGNPSLLNVYNVLLIRRRRPGGSGKDEEPGALGRGLEWDERIGVGKMSSFAFWHAHPTTSLVVLR